MMQDMGPKNAEFLQMFGINCFTWCCVAEDERWIFLVKEGS